MCAFRDWRADLGDLDARVFGASVDTPWALLAFIEEYGIDYPMLSGFNNSLIEEYGMTVDAGIVTGIAGRSVFVIDEDRTVRYRWEGEDLRTLPDLQAVESALAGV